MDSRITASDRDEIERLMDAACVRYALCQIAEAKDGSLPLVQWDIISADDVISLLSKPHGKQAFFFIVREVGSRGTTE